MAARASEASTEKVFSAKGAGSAGALRTISSSANLRFDGEKEK